MKSLKAYVSERNNLRLPQYVVEAFLEINKELKSLVEKMMDGLDYSALKEYDQYDPEKFDKQKDNELLIAGKLDEDGFKAIGTAEYYEMTVGGKFKDLNRIEKSEYDTKHGDIIILKDEVPVYFIDVKISEKYLGAISLGSLVNFDENGYYLLICTKDRYYKLISHKDVVSAVKKGKLTLNEPVNGRVGYPVEWENEDKTSEWFIKGNDLKKL